MTLEKKDPKTKKWINVSTNTKKPGNYRLTQKIVYKSPKKIKGVKRTLISYLKLSSVKTTKLKNNAILVSKNTFKSNKTYKQVYSSNKWINTSNSNNNTKYPNKKFRNLTVNYKVTTKKYTNVTKNYKFPKNSKVTYSNNKKDATVITKKIISYNKKNIPNPFLQNSSNCNPKNPTIKKKALELSKGKKDKAAADRILAYVQKRIEYPDPAYGGTKYGDIKTYKGKIGNCADSSHLTVSLLRAAGIPAQYHRKGLVVTVNKTTKEKHESGHVWPEVYVYYNGKYQWLPGEATDDDPTPFRPNAIKGFYKKVNKPKYDYPLIDYPF